MNKYFNRIACHKQLAANSIACRKPTTNKKAAKLHDNPCILATYASSYSSSNMLYPYNR